MEPDQLHALSIHELQRRQDLAQHRPAGTEGLQHFGKAGQPATGTVREQAGEQTRGLHGPPEPPFKQQNQPARPNGHLEKEIANTAGRNGPLGSSSAVSLTPPGPASIQGTFPAPSSHGAPAPGAGCQAPKAEHGRDRCAGRRAGQETWWSTGGALGPSWQG